MKDFFHRGIIPSDCHILPTFFTIKTVFDNDDKINTGFEPMLAKISAVIEMTIYFSIADQKVLGVEEILQERMCKVHREKGCQRVIILALY